MRSKTMTGLMAACASAILGSSAHADSWDAFFDSWGARAHAALASEPHWAPAINTPSPRLTQVVRYDQYWESTGAPAGLDNYGAGKGVEIIPFDTTSFTFNLPPYEQRYKKSAAANWADWPIVLVKQRLLAAAPADGDYVVTGYLTVQAPIGATAFTNHAWLITPGFGFGKGWGDLDIQGSLTASLPTKNVATIGTAIASNLTAQYHLAGILWPEVELNDTTWSGGSRAGLNQLFMTVGSILGNVPLFDNYTLGIGFGYQFALSPRIITASALTPTYDHNWIMTLRLGY